MRRGGSGAIRIDRCTWRAPSGASASGRAVRKYGRSTAISAAEISRSSSTVAITSWVSDPDPDADPRQARAVDSTLTRVMLAASDAKVLDFADRAAAEPEWREAALMSNSTVVATVDELREISAGMMAVLRPYFRTTRPLEDAPEGARQVHMSIRMAPEPPRPGSA